MPNRKTFNERDKYDHSSHSTVKPEKGDLAATPDAGPQAGPPMDEPGVGSDTGVGAAPADRKRRATPRR